MTTDNLTTTKQRLERPFISLRPSNQSPGFSSWSEQSPSEELLVHHDRTQGVTRVLAHLFDAVTQPRVGGHQTCFPQSLQGRETRFEKNGYTQGWKQESINDVIKVNLKDIKFSLNLSDFKDSGVPTWLVTGMAPTSPTVTVWTTCVYFGDNMCATLLTREAPGLSSDICSWGILNPGPGNQEVVPELMHDTSFRNLSFNWPSAKHIVVS